MNIIQVATRNTRTPSQWWRALCRLSSSLWPASISTNLWPTLSYSLPTVSLPTVSNSLVLLPQNLLLFVPNALPPKALSRSEAILSRHPQCLGALSNQNTESRPNSTVGGFTCKHQSWLQSTPNFVFFLLMERRDTRSLQPRIRSKIYRKVRNPPFPLKFEIHTIALKQRRIFSDILPHPATPMAQKTSAVSSLVSVTKPEPCTSARKLLEEQEEERPWWCLDPAMGPSTPAPYLPSRGKRWWFS